MPNSNFAPILGFGINSYRSFGPHQARFGPCEQINLLIGQNNSGKSNALRFIQDRYRFLGNPGSAIPKLEGLERNKSPEKADVRLSFAVRISLQIRNEWDKITIPGGTASLLDRVLEQLDPCGPGYWIDMELPRGTDRLQPTERMVDAVIRACGSPQNLHSLSLKLFNQANSGSRSAEVDNSLRFINYLSTNCVERVECLTIPAVRKPGVGQYDETTLGGEDLVHRLARLQNPSYEQQTLKEDFGRLERFLQSVTDRPNARLEIPFERDMVIAHMDGRSLPLTALGTGIHEVVILAAIATVFHHRVICIEEPEVHLHPLLQRKLLRYLEEQTDNQYFISTHSAHFLNREGAAIFHVRLEEGSSAVTLATASHERYSICHDLGYQASDLLEVNCVIWVEGPSDRIYLQAWIKQRRPALEEGVDYSIMFYGGRLLSHLTPDDAEVNDFISLRLLNRHSCVVMDSDRETADAPINPTKQRILNTWGDHPGFAWVTQGREIENYVQSQVMFDALNSVAGNKPHKLPTNPFFEPLIGKDGNGRPLADKVKVARWLVENDRLVYQYSICMRK